MTVYADSSFLVSCLYSEDSGYRAAKTFFLKRADDEWLTSSWSQFETINSLRQLHFQKPGLSPEVPEALKRLFRHWHERGNFTFYETDADEAINESAQISAAKGTQLKMRSADVLHIALLEQINPDLFVTRDRAQHILASQRAFNSQLIN